MKVSRTSECHTELEIMSLCRIKLYDHYTFALGFLKWLDVATIFVDIG